MPSRAIEYTDSDITIVSRDDGLISFELRDEERALQGVVTFPPDVAIALGKILVSKGVNLNAQLQALTDSAESWTDRDGNVWHGAKDSEVMTSDSPDFEDHSWDELLQAFGPLTQINA